MNRKQPYHSRETKTALNSYSVLMNMASRALGISMKLEASSIIPCVSLHCGQSCVTTWKQCCRLISVFHVSVPHTPSVVWNNPQTTYLFKLYIEGYRPEWCISSMIYSGDTPFWSETLELWRTSVPLFHSKVGLCGHWNSSTLLIYRRVGRMVKAFASRVTHLGFIPAFSVRIVPSGIIPVT